jgi:hypothetical protein
VENFISTVVFILPGFLMYFWIQAFGVNPVVKHSSTEVAAISALLWIPVSLITLATYNLIGIAYHQITPIWTLDRLKDESSNLFFLLFFLVISVFISFLLSNFYVKVIYPYQSRVINSIREKRGVAPFSEMPSVWDEVFGGNDIQTVNISKIDKQNECIIGEVSKAPRPFEAEKCFSLLHVDFLTRLVEEYKIPVTSVFIDTKSGTCIKIYDQSKLEAAYEKDNRKEQQ